MRVLMLSFVLMGCGSSQPKDDRRTEPEREPVMEPSADHEPPQADPNEPMQLDASGMPLTCVRYLASMRACLATMPAEGQQGMAAAMEEMETQWRAVAKENPEALHAACVAALDAARQAMTSSCPDVTW